jgi:transposase
VVAERAAFRRRARRRDLNRYVFVDEFGLNMGMTRRYARAPRGVRAVGHAPVNYGDNITLVFGVRLSGIVAPMLIKGPMDGAVWDKYVRQYLAPKLRPNDIVAYDGLGAHRSAAARAALHRRGALVGKLPPYSPDYSPAEPGGSKVKSALRAVEARDFATIVDATGVALRSITPADRRGWFHHSGYRLPQRKPP